MSINPNAHMMMMPVPPWAFEQPEPVVGRSSTVVPTRVCKAMEFLSLLQRKTAKRVAVTEHEVHEIDGQELTPEESNAQCAAANCLANYFDGRLKMDQWEEMAYQSSQNDDSGTDVIAPCVMCARRRAIRRDCPLCHGSGYCVARAAESSEIAEELAREQNERGSQQGG